MVIYKDEEKRWHKGWHTEDGAQGPDHADRNVCFETDIFQYATEYSILLQTFICCLPLKGVLSHIHKMWILSCSESVRLVINLTPYQA